jgi:outer membrane protein assembly factor BamB
MSFQAEAQAPVPGEILPARAGVESLMPASDRDAETWLKRAAEAAGRGDWKLAADTLERVINQHGDRTVTMDEGQHFYSAIYLAQAQIADWPPDGLAAYRILYDPEARRLLEKAKGDHDLAALREIARKYAHTQPGPEAMTLLVDWLIDQHQPGEAIELLDRLAELPGTAIPPGELILKQAVAYTLTGERGRAAAAIERMRRLGSNTHAALPEDWRNRIEQIQRFFEDTKLESSHLRTGSPELWTSAAWPYRLGPAVAQGRMAAIAPVMTEESSQSVMLPGSGSLNHPDVRRVIRRQGRPPVWQAVSDGRRLFVTCPAGLFARDPATSDFLWQAFVRHRRRDPRITNFRLRAGILGNQTFEIGDEKNRLDSLATRTLFHEYRGEVSTAFGQVFVIEQEESPGEQRPSLQGVIPLSPAVEAEELTAPNTLRAYESDTGRAVWTKGRGGPRGDVLKFAHFYAAPVATGPFLVVPYVVQNDLLLAVLKPDGTLVKQVLLGGGRPGMFPMNGTLQPTVHDGTIYVPSGAGLLLALNAYDFSLRWLTAYERSSRLTLRTAGRRPAWFTSGTAPPQADEWLTSPPVAAGGKVLLAPHDSEALLAFDPRNGEQVWAFPRGEHRYMVGADDKRILIAGRAIEAIDIATGQSQWTSEDVRPSGRPVLCDEEILVPTEEGLVRLDLATGRQVGDLAPTDEPLGNLLAIDGSLVSIGADRIAAFSDPVQSQALARARLAKNPDDIEALIRLARLTMLMKDWNGAMALLDQAEEKLARVAAETGQAGSKAQPGSREISAGSVATPTADLYYPEALDHLSRQIAHQRVVSLLNAASESTTEQRQTYLSRAVETAERPDDKVKAGLALMELLVERHRVLEAFKQAVSLLGQAGQEPMRLDVHHQARAGVLIAERLQRFWREMSAADRADASGYLDAVADDADAKNDQAFLTQLADNFGFVAFGARLDLALGRRAIERGSQETGVFFLERAAGRASSRSVRLEALLRLVAAYLWPGENLPAAPNEAAAGLKRLSAEFEEDILPPGLPTGSIPSPTPRGDGAPVPTGSIPSPTPRGDGAPVLPPGLPMPGGVASDGTVGAFVRTVKATLPVTLFADQPALPRILKGAGRLRLLQEDAVPDPQLRDGASFWDSDQRHDIYAKVLPLEVAGQVRGLNLAGEDSGGRAFFWTADLDSELGRAEEASFGTASWLGDAQVAAVAGRIAALRTRFGVVGLGLTSGRMMWPPLEVDQVSGASPEPAIVNGRGVIVVAVNGNTLVAVRARDESGPLWRRRWPSNQLKLLRVVGEHLVVVDRDAEKAFILDPLSGRIRREYWLLVGKTSKAPESDDREAMDPDAHVAIVGNVIWRSGERAVVGRDVATGTTVWTIAVDGLVKALFELDPRHLGICYGSDRLRVVASQTGEVIQDISATGLSMPPQDAVIDVSQGSGHVGSGRLLLFTRSSDIPAEYILSSFPVDKGGQSWRLELGPFATISHQMMRASPDYVAVVRNQVVVRETGRSFRGPEQQVNQEVPPRLEIVHKPTGRRLGPSPYEFGEGVLGERGHFSRLITDVIVLNDRIVAAAPEGYFVLAVEEESR